MHRIIAIIKLINVFIFVLASSKVSYAQAPDTIWTKTYGGIDNDIGYSVMQTDDGGFIIVGSTSSFEVDSSDVYLIKTDSNGDTLWTRTYGGDNHDIGYSVCKSSEGGYVITGETRSFGVERSDIYFIKTDSNGDTIWTHTYGGAGWDGGHVVQHSSNETIMAAGQFQNDAFLMKLDNNGDSLWMKRYHPGGMVCSGGSLEETFDGGYIVIIGISDMFGGPATCILKTNENGDSLWAKGHGGFDASIKQMPNEDYIFSCTVGDQIIGVQDIFVARLNSMGDTLWTRIYGEEYPMIEWNHSLDLVPGSGAIITGFKGPIYTGDLYVLRININGDSLWTLSVGGTETDAGHSIIYTDDGFVVAGYTRSFGQGEGDIYLLKLEPEQTSADFMESFPNSISLSQNYPNPLNASTTIKFIITEAQNVRLAVYDILGRSVETLINEKHQAGCHQVTWRADEYPSGIYFYRIEAGDYKETKKMLLLK